MRIKLQPLLLLSAILCVGSMNNSFAQEQKVEFEKTKEQCEGVPFEDRVRIVVTDFEVTSPKVPYREFGVELATMLTNALYKINCFRVLENIDVMQSGNTSKEQELAQGELMHAQAILTGEITEFGSSDGRAQVLGVGVKNPKVRFGFILKVVNIGTREVIWSESIEVVSKKGGAFSGLSFGNLINIAGSTKFNKAEADAVERGIIKAMYVLAEAKDNIPFPEVDNSSTTFIEVSETGFMDLQKLMNALKTDSRLKSVARSAFQGNQGTLEVKHEMSNDDVINIVAEKGAGFADIIGFEGNVIQVKIANK